MRQELEVKSQELQAKNTTEKEGENQITTLDMDSSGAFLMPVSQSAQTYGTPTSSWIAARVNGNGSTVDKTVEGGERQARQDLSHTASKGTSSAEIRLSFLGRQGTQRVCLKGLPSGGRRDRHQNGCTTTRPSRRFTEDNIIINKMSSILSIVDHISNMMVFISLSTGRLSRIMSMMVYSSRS